MKLLLLTPIAKERGAKVAADLKNPEFEDVDFQGTWIERSPSPHGTEELLFGLWRPNRTGSTRRFEGLTHK